MATISRITVTNVCEDETTITLSFDGKIQKMVKAFTKLTLI